MISGRFGKFLASGVVNTLATYAIYLSLLLFIPFYASYTIAFVCGIVLAYLLNRYFIFNTHRGISSALALPLIYALQYLLGITLIWVMVSKFYVSPVIAPLVVIAATVPVTYFLSRWAFVHKNTHS